MAAKQPVHPLRAKMIERFKKPPQPPKEADTNTARGRFLEKFRKANEKVEDR